MAHVSWGSWEHKLFQPGWGRWVGLRDYSNCFLLVSLCLVSGRLLICVCWSGLTSRQEGSPLQLSRTPILCSSLLSALWIIGICYLALYPWIFEFLNNIWIFKCLNYILNATHQEMKMSKKFQEEPSHSMLWLALISIHEIFVCICIWQAWISTHKLRYMSNIAVLTSFKLNLTVSFYSTRQTGRLVSVSLRFIVAACLLLSVVSFCVISVLCWSSLWWG